MYTIVYGDAQKVSKYGKAVNVGLIAAHKIVSEYPESINLIRRVFGKNICVNGEHAKSLSALLPRQET